MIPSWWQFTVLALGAYRLTRLGGWDDWPPIYKLRAWVIGERWYYSNAADSSAPELPGKQPNSEANAVRVGYDRPLLAHLVHCPFCLGWWVSAACWACWLPFPHFTVIALTPFALSGVVGVIAKNLDA